MVVRPLSYLFHVRGAGDLSGDASGTGSPRKKAPKQYVWSSESKNKYLETLKSDDVQIKWEKCVELDHSDPNIAVNYISGVLVGAAERAKIRSVRGTSGGDPPWFDDDCR